MPEFTLSTFCIFRVQFCLLILFIWNNKSFNIFPCTKIYNEASQLQTRNNNHYVSVSKRERERKSIFIAIVSVLLKVLFLVHLHTFSYKQLCAVKPRFVKSNYWIERLIKRIIFKAIDLCIWHAILTSKTTLPDSSLTIIWLCSLNNIELFGLCFQQTSSNYWNEYKECWSSWFWIQFCSTNQNVNLL